MQVTPDGAVRFLTKAEAVHELRNGGEVYRFDGKRLGLDDAGKLFLTGEGTPVPDRVAFSKATGERAGKLGWAP